MTTKNHGTFLRADTDNHPPGVVTDYIDSTDQGSDPSAPGSGHTAVYTKTGGLYIENHAGTVTGPFVASTLTNPMTTLGDIIYGANPITGGLATPARKGIGGSNTVLHGGFIPPSYTAVIEGDFGFTDITTANATTGQHGLLLKLGGGTTNYLRADGTWNQPPGTGASPLTTKGDVWGYSSVDARIPIGTNGQVLTADSAQTLGLKWATPSAGGGGGSVPVWVQSTHGNGNSQNPTLFTFGSAPVSGHSIIVGLNMVGRGATALASTNTTWTKVDSGTSGGGSHYEIWVGVVSGTGGTAVSMTTGSSNFWSVLGIEVTDALTPTLGAHAEGATTANIGTGGTMTGGTATRFVAMLLGADNTSNSFAIIPNMPYVTCLITTASGLGTALAVGYVPTGGIVQAIMSALASSVGEYVICEIT